MSASFEATPSNFNVLYVNLKEKCSCDKKYNATCLNKCTSKYVGETWWYQFGTIVSFSQTHRQYFMPLDDPQ